MAKQKGEQWESLFDGARKELLDFFRSGADEKEVLARARVATAVLSAFTRHEATERARVSTIVGVARQLASSPQEFAEYLRVSAPQVAPPKVLMPGDKLKAEQDV